MLLFARAQGVWGRGVTTKLSRVSGKGTKLELPADGAAGDLGQILTSLEMYRIIILQEKCPYLKLPFLRGKRLTKEMESTALIVHHS